MGDQDVTAKGPPPAPPVTMFGKALTVLNSRAAGVILPLAALAAFRFGNHRWPTWDEWAAGVTLLAARTDRGMQLLTSAANALRPPPGPPAPPATDPR